ncbi:MAG: hypothetical protein WD270_13825 [Acetobacterales bacterium]
MPHEMALHAGSFRPHPLEGAGFANRRAAHETMLKEGFFSAGDDRYRDHSGLCVAVVPVRDHVELMVLEQPAPDFCDEWLEEDDVRFIVRPPQEVLESRPLRAIRRRRRRRRVWLKAALAAPIRARAGVTLREIGIAIGAVCSIVGSGALLGALLAHLISRAMLGVA